MKRITITILLLIASVVGAMAQNDAMFIYRTDGTISAFVKADIDSVRHSFVDLNGVKHNSYVVQEIWTADSLYRIPVNEIDSISFITPKPVYKEGVQRLSDNINDYVISCTDTTITFMPSVPSHLLPVVGQTFMSDTFEEPFPDGFSGRMAGMKQYPDSVVCYFEPVELEDVYSHLLLVGSASSYSADNGVKGQRRIQFGDNDWRIPMPASISAGAGMVSAQLTNPSIRIDYFVCIGEPNRENTVQVRARFNSTGNIKLELKGSGTYGKEPHWVKSIPFKVGVVAGCIDFGWFCQTTGSIKAEVDFPFNVAFGGGFTYTQDGGMKPDDAVRSFHWEQPIWKASIDGTLYAGVASRLSFGVLHSKVASVDLTGKFGPEVSASFTIDSEEGLNTTLYDNLKNVKVKEALKLELEPGYRVWFCDRKDFFGTNLTFRFFERSVPLLPSIYSLSWKRQSASSGELNADVWKDIFVPCRLGWALYDDDELKSTDYLPGYYWIQRNWPNGGLKHQLSDLPKDCHYKAYPVARLMDMVDIRFAQNVEIQKIPVKIKEFKVTDTHYQKGAYYNDGLHYDYKFDAATTVEIESLEGVVDWGYVYRDPYGNEKRISLMEYGMSYTDTRYAYYRNMYKSTACLYGYVKYKGEDEYLYDKPQEFLLECVVKHGCPDNQHPHAIDLVLPSGTKWCCMNVGASSPEQYGGFYAWGETSEKSVYNDSTYSFVTGEPFFNGWYTAQSLKFQNIGTDIAGTSCDVAHVRMGSPWRMPDYEQLQELFHYCSSEITQQNGVNGILLTGKNGGQIFLPAAGYRLGEPNDYEGRGEDYYYWSSTVLLEDSIEREGEVFEIGYYDAYVFMKESHGYNYDTESRVRGLSVRAVCP